MDKFDAIHIMSQFLGRSGKRALAWLLIGFVLIGSIYFPDAYSFIVKAIFTTFAQSETDKIMKIVQPILDSFSK